MFSFRRARISRSVPASLLAACIGLACAACGSSSGAPYASTVDAGSATADSGPPTPDVVTVPNVGMIAGSKTATMRSFKGIPYAAPPVGPLRWKPPQKAAPLTGRPRRHEVRQRLRPGPEPVRHGFDGRRLSLPERVRADGHRAVPGHVLDSRRRVPEWRVQ